MRASGGTSRPHVSLPAAAVPPPGRGGLLASRRSRSLRPLPTPRRRSLLILLLLGARRGGLHQPGAAANATDSTWIPAPAQRAAVCIVDTGNDPNPDTSNVVARLSVDGEPGTDRSPDHHGTLMSMIAAAPYNGFGMVGAAPSINVVSVRASRDGVTFGGTDLARAVQRCIAYRNTYNIKVISLSLGGAVVVRTGRRADGHRGHGEKRPSRGLNVVAAAGNHHGAVDWPAAYDPVMAVGAADQEGGGCAFAASGPEVDLWAWAVPLTQPSGRRACLGIRIERGDRVRGRCSGAASSARPSVDGRPADRALTSRALVASVGLRLDVSAAFMAAGLADQLVVGHSMIPRTVSRCPVGAKPSAPSSLATGEAMPPVARAKHPAVTPHSSSERLRTRLPIPSVGPVRLRRQVLSLPFKNKPQGIDARVQIYAQMTDHAFPVLVRTLRVRGDRVRTGSQERSVKCRSSIVILKGSDRLQY